MRVGALIVSILMISSLSMTGCSKEKSADINKKVVIKKNISKPPAEKIAGETAPAEKVAEKAAPVDTPAPQPSTTKAEDIKAPEPVKEYIYIAKGTEGLSDIAARDTVYGDRLKWILLYRFNRGALEGIAKDERFPDKPVPAETRLKTASQGDIKTTAKGDTEHWVINVISSPEEKLVVRDAVTLVDNGYPAYITSATVKGQRYIRLRVGFYDEKTRAEDEGRKISAMLNISDLWTTRADGSEYKEFGGYK